MFYFMPHKQSDWYRTNFTVYYHVKIQVRYGLPDQITLDSTWFYHFQEVLISDEHTCNLIYAQSNCHARHPIRSSGSARNGNMKSLIVRKHTYLGFEAQSWALSSRMKGVDARRYSYVSLLMRNLTGVGDEIKRQLAKSSGVIVGREYVTHAFHDSILQ